MIASSALVIGALVGGWFTIPKRVLAAMLAFAAGALITALTFELFEKSYHPGGLIVDRATPDFRPADPHH
ncbi:hypothetical protein P3H15_48295 [Rhodococcus sp. T2V]|nr:hypothetical protein [Rhodococcus sp. T2V]